MNSRKVHVNAEFDDDTYLSSELSLGFNCKNPYRQIDAKL